MKRGKKLFIFPMILVFFHLYYMDVEIKTKRVQMLTYQ